jgi:hypothetical protein
MRPLLAFAMFFLLPSITSGQDMLPSYCPHTAELPRNSVDNWFDGDLGSHHVRLYTGHGGGATVGLYYDLADWKPVLLGGTWDAKDGIRSTASTSDAEPVTLGNLVGSARRERFHRNLDHN